MHFLDTNAVIWLYQGETEKFTPKTLGILEGKDLYVSPFVELELQYLYEIGRIKKQAFHVLEVLHKTIGLGIHNTTLSIIIKIATKQNWTRDPFDRLITSQAIAESGCLITRDKVILKNYKKAIW